MENRLFLKPSFAFSLIGAGLVVFMGCLSSCKKDTDTFDFDAQKVREEAIIREYLEDNGLYEQATRTESGLYYYPLVDTAGLKVPDDTLTTIHYAGILLYGDTFDASRPKGTPILIQSNTGYIFRDFVYTDYDSTSIDTIKCVTNTATPPVTHCDTLYVPTDSIAGYYDGSDGKSPSGVIAGWTEGISLMKPGQIMRFYIPSHLGYGGQSKGYIPPLSILVFDIELIKIGY